MIRVLKDLHKKQEMIEQQPVEDKVPSLPSIAAMKLVAANRAAEMLLRGRRGSGAADKDTKTSSVTQSGSVADVTSGSQATQTSTGTGVGGEVAVQADVTSSSVGSEEGEGGDEEREETESPLINEEELKEHHNEVQKTSKIFKFPITLLSFDMMKYFYVWNISGRKNSSATVRKKVGEKRQCDD